MDRVLYVSMSGAKQAMLAQAANNHNLANVNTTGFLADLHQFRSMPVLGDGYATRVYAMDERVDTDFSRGSVEITGRDLDIAINGEGWLAVQGPDGEESYTRAGNLRIQSTGMLTTIGGHPVLGNGGPVVIPPVEKLEIGSDGSISIVPLGQEASTMALVDRIKLVNPSMAQLKKAPNGLLQLKTGETSPTDASVKIMSGSLEASNVNAVEALVTMIGLSRQYEMQVKVMKAAEEADALTTQMMRVS